MADMGAPYGLLVHGGAGVDPERLAPAARRRAVEGLEAALAVGSAVLAAGGAALDAAEAAVACLEDHPSFNAGRGAVLTHEGDIALDAALVDGATGRAGAVCGLRRARNPVRVARAVMEHSPHVMLAGAGADRFVVERGLATAPKGYFVTPPRRRQWRRALEVDRVTLDHAPALGTVGAVALDRAGHLAAATSTGGMTNKRWGRVGDSPVIGAGVWARDATCAVSCTGHGEHFLREVAAHSVHARVAFGGASLEEAARAVIFDQIGRGGGTGGLIALDARGRAAAPFHAAGMYRGLALSDGRRAVAVGPGEGWPLPEP